MALPRTESLRILSLDGGGIKGYTSLIILQRIFRTLQDEAKLEALPKPCDVFDLIVGTSTGGLIAIMLGRLKMTIDEAIEQYELVGKRVFGKRPRFGWAGKLGRGLTGKAFYDIKVLQECVKDALESKRIAPDEGFIADDDTASCKVMVCVTSKFTANVDALRSYTSYHPTTHNYDCTIWEAASATAAAPIFFDRVKFRSGDEFVDGGLRRNNPVEEALNEARKESDLKGREVGCLVSIGTGLHSIKKFPSDVTRVLKHAVKMMTDSQDIADRFSASNEGRQLAESDRYFRFNVPQGMEDLKLDEYEEADRMKALALNYLRKEENGRAVAKCAQALANSGTQRNKVDMSQLNPLTDIEIKYLGSLNFPGIHQRRYSIKPPAQHTCEWLFQHETFDSWLNRRNAETHKGLICIRGNPGSGKSTLMQEAYRRTQRQAQGNYNTAAFFFDSKGDKISRSPKALYSSLLHQLLPHRREDLRRLVEAYKEKQPDGKGDPVLWNEDELRAHLQSLFMEPSSSRTVIFIDAMDECDDRKSREVANFFRDLTERAHSMGVRLDACLSSRHFNAVMLRDCPVIIVERNNASDISQYLNQRLVPADGDKDSCEAFNRLRTKATEMSSGIFLWVALVTEILLKDRDEGRTMSDLEDRLSKIPDVLEDLFRDLLKKTRAEDRDITLRVFQWAILGGELRLHDWRSIFLFLERRLPLYPLEGKKKNDRAAKHVKKTGYVMKDGEVERRIRHISMGLVEVMTPANSRSREETSSSDNSINGGAGSLDLEAGDTRIVAVIHRSVREFFLHQDGFLVLDPDLGFGAVGKGHVAIMHTCLDYIGLSELDELVNARQDIQSENASEDTGDAESLESGRGHSSRASTVGSFSSARSLRFSRALRAPSSTTSSRSGRSAEREAAFRGSPPTGVEESASADLIALAGQQPTGKEMLAYRLSLLDLRSTRARDVSTPSIASIEFSSMEAEYRRLPVDPSFLQYILATFSIHARSAEKEGANATKVVRRLREAGLWRRWISLNEKIPKNTKLMNWAEAEGLTSWVIYLSSTKAEPDIVAAANEGDYALALSLIQEKPVLDYCLDRGYRFLETANGNSLLDTPPSIGRPKPAFFRRWLTHRIRLKYEGSSILDYGFVPHQSLLLELPLSIIDQLLMEMELPGGIAPEIFAAFRTVLGILLWIEEPKSIVDFVQHGFNDTCLPVQITGRYAKGKSCLRSRGKKEVIRPAGWNEMAYEVFEHRQWSFLMPFFRRPQPEILHYRLKNPGDRLPIMETYVISPDISKIRLHSLCYECSDFPLHPEDGWFVRKQKKHWKTFLSEVHAWKLLDSQCRGRGKSKLMPLLFTVEMEESNYLIFPWPSGDLNDLWKAHPDGGKTDIHTPEWMASQCSGISDCLSIIHRNEKSRRHQTWNQALPQRSLLKHGDVTTENIFWFANSRGQGDGGTLVLSNFTLGRRMARSSAYTAPELFLASQSRNGQRCRVGRRADIWGLACTWIEFATWYLGGLEELSRNRDLASTSRWEFDDDDDDEDERRASRLSVVDWVRRLHRHQNCTPYCHEFLSYIEERMLVIDPKERATALEVSEKMNELRERALGNEAPSPCLEGCPRPMEPKWLAVTRKQVGVL